MTEIIIVDDLSEEEHIEKSLQEAIERHERAKEFKRADNLRELLWRFKEGD